jgi:3-dehydroquinate dehydratase type I
MVEVRLDGTNFDEAQVQELFSLGNSTIATFRKNRISDSQRARMLAAAAEAGASYVDLDLGNDAQFIENVIEAARRHDTGIIVSYHNYAETPVSDEMTATLAACAALGADIIKIACFVQNEADAARLLSLYGTEFGRTGQLIAIGMGEKGKITRLAAPLLGAPFTYAAVAPGKETAAGQYDYETLARLLDSI